MHVDAVVHGTRTTHRPSDSRTLEQLRLARYLVPVLAVLQLSSVVTEVITSFAFHPSYNWIRNTISELGVKRCTSDFDPRKEVEACSPLADLMNAGMAVSGLSLILLVLLLRRTPGFRGWAGALWAVAGAGSVVTAFVTLDVSPILHQLVSMPLFFGGPLAMLVGAFQFSGRMRVAAATIGAVALVLGVLFSTSDAVYGYGGVIERLVIWTVLAWLVMLAARHSRAAAVEVQRRRAESVDA